MQIDPVAHDTAIAALYFELAKAKQNARYADSRLFELANAKYYYRGRRRVTDMNVAEAFEIVAAKADESVTYRAAEYLTAIEKYENAQLAIGNLEIQIEAMEEQYTGWSRFFLVTSSQGHIHSSMHCTTCFPTTTYGWLPELSGSTEEQAVAQCGETLCTACFTSAPVSWQGGRISQAQAEKMAWSPDRDEKIARREAEAEAKAAAKAKKAANKLKYDESLAHKVNNLVDKFGDGYHTAYKFTWTTKGYDNAYSVYSDMIERRNIRRARAR